jgi:MOSC domain-containing protein YiiM
VTGRVEALWVKRAHRGVMDRANEVLVDEAGIVGNADRGGRRQITLVAEERWAQVGMEFGEDLDPTIRRANIMVSGLELADTRGATVTLGEVVLEVTTETVPCRLMDFAREGLMEALRPAWGGGISARVIRSGTISVGDHVALERPVVQVRSVLT